MAKRINVAELACELENHKTIGLMTHLLGDGDAFGSMLGLKNILESLGKKVIIFSNEKPTDALDFMKEEIEYHPKEKFEKVDALILLDVNVLKRTTIPKIFSDAQKHKVTTIIVDHHAAGDLYDQVDFFIQDPEASSASEIVYYLAEELSWKLDRKTADVLLLGIETDTNFMQNSNVKKSTLMAKAGLLRSGARAKKIQEYVKNHKPIKDLKFLGEILKRIKADKKRGIVATYITSEDLKKFDIEPGVSSQVASFLDRSRDARVVFVAEDREGGKIKVSMRSNNSTANVSKLGEFFGGGGHVKAAGFEIDGKLDDLLS